MATQPEPRKRKTYEGVICPKILDNYTYLSVPRTEEQCYELTWDDFRAMSGKLDGKPLCSVHGDIPVGKIKRNWATGDGQWCVEFEIDDESLVGYDMATQVDGGTLNSLSLKHHHGQKEPYEVSLVYDPGRPGSDIIRDGTKKGPNYKAPETGTQQGWTRDTVIAAAKGAMAHIRLHNDQDDKKQSDFSIVKANAGGNLSQLEAAEALIAREQKAAQDAVKKTEDARKAIDLAKRREMNAQQHKQMDQPRKPQETTPMQMDTGDDGSIALPEQIPSAGDQVRAQVESQVNAAQQQQGGSLAMTDEDEDMGHSQPTGQQIQKQINRQIPSGRGLVQAGAQQQQPERITGDPDVDAVLSNPSVAQNVKESLIASMEKRRAEETKMKKEIEAAKAHSSKAEKALQEYRENYVATNMAFQQKVLGQFDKQGFQEMADKARSGEMDDFIMSKATQGTIAAQKKALKRFTKSDKTQETMSMELLARARALDQSLGGGNSSGIAHSFSSSSHGDRRVVAAGRKPSRVPSNPYAEVEPEDDEDDDETMGLGMPSEFKKPAKRSGKDSKEEVISAGKSYGGGGGSSRSSFGHSGSTEEFQPWNVRLEASLRRKAIDRMAAQSLYVPETLPKDHPVVISASKGGLGFTLPKTAVDHKGCPPPEYFHPDTLALVIGDGSDVTDQFTLFPEDPEHANGEDLGGGNVGSRSSRKRSKYTS